MKISWASKKVSVHKAGSKGSGLFAAKNIKRNEIISVLGGYVIPLREFKGMKGNSLSHHLIYNYAYHISDDLLFSPVRRTEISEPEYINHSCDPNTGFRGEIRFAAMKDIKQGEEITIDYAVCMTSSLFNMKCLCGSKFCRKFITGGDWKKTNLQKKYKGFFQPYIAEKIKKQ